MVRLALLVIASFCGHGALALPVAQQHTSRLDLDRDGRVAGDELEGSLFADYGIDATEAKGILRASDVNNDNILEGDEVAAAEARVNAAVHERAETWIKANDFDRDAHIQLGEFLVAAFVETGLPRPQLEDIFMAADSQKDGLLDETEVVEARRMLRSTWLRSLDALLKEFDSSGDAQLSASEALLMADRTFDIGTVEAKDVLVEADRNKDGSIGGVSELGAFIAALRARAIENAKTDVKVTDSSGNGKISYDEAKARFGVDGRQFKRIFKEFDVNKNLFVEPVEFVAMRAAVEKSRYEPSSASTPKVIHLHPKMHGNVKMVPRRKRYIEDDFSFAIDENDPDWGLYDDRPTLRNYKIMQSVSLKDGVPVGAGEEPPLPLVTEQPIIPQTRRYRKMLVPNLEQGKPDRTILVPVGPSVMPNPPVVPDAPVNPDLPTNPDPPTPVDDFANFKTVKAVSTLENTKDFTGNSLFDILKITSSTTSTTTTTTSSTTPSTTESTADDEVEGSAETTMENAPEVTAETTETTETAETTETTLGDVQQDEPTTTTTRKVTQTLDPVAFTIVFGDTTTTTSPSTTMAVSEDDATPSEKESEEGSGMDVDDSDDAQQTATASDVEKQHVFNATVTPLLEEVEEDMERVETPTAEDDEASDDDDSVKTTLMSENEEEDATEATTAGQKIVNDNDVKSAENEKLGVTENDENNKTPNGLDDLEGMTVVRAKDQADGAVEKDLSIETLIREFSSRTKRSTSHEAAPEEAVDAKLAERSREQWEVLSAERLRQTGGSGGGQLRPIDETVVNEPWRRKKW